MAHPALQRIPVEVEAAGVILPGDLTLPPGPIGVVLFAHGSGSSRFSPRNQFVADSINDYGLATLLFDLLSEAENEIDMRTRRLRFDIALLTERLIAAIDWARDYPAAAGLRIGLFGASTGAAAALAAAAERPDQIAAVVSRGGRPDLAGDALRCVCTPTLMIVGGNDDLVLKLNRESSRQIRAECRIEVVPGASHLFEEPGALEQVAHLARDWFRRYLGEKT